jgi:hypothetical protein
MDHMKHCKRCGVAIFKSPEISMAQWKSRMFCSKRCGGLRRLLTDDEIAELYRTGQSTGQISMMIGVSAVQVARVIRRKGITRTPKERQKLAQSQPGRRERNAEVQRGRQCPENVKDTLRQLVGPLNANWRSGIAIGKMGYLCFTASSANGAHARKALHVVIAEWKIGRPLTKGEVVHHVDGNKMNNDPANLDVMSHSAHARLHAISNKLGTYRRKENVR